MPSLTPDPWSGLRRFTPARIALGRAGSSLPTAELLDFALAHAAARDAVQSLLNLPALMDDLRSLNAPLMVCRTQVNDRATYLQRPDLGGRLDDASRADLIRVAGGAQKRGSADERGSANERGSADERGSAEKHSVVGADEGSRTDLSIVISDGLSAMAAQSHAAALLRELLPRLRGDNLTLAPIVIAPFARVALQDDVGAALNARASLIVLGERPGLGSPDSLGGYLVFNPRPGNTNAQRNCVSNIRPAGLPPSAAAAALHYLIRESLRRRLSGVELKDEHRWNQLSP
jgi:ethanolamine ammonia-lyase small subunit